MRAAAAFLAALAVGLGAFGAHGLRERFLADPRLGDWWETATFYLLVHAVASTCLPGVLRWPRMLLLAGAVIFSGTLFAMALGAPRWLGAVTPMGGTMLLVGWVWAAVAFAKEEGAGDKKDEEMKG